jgi:acyl-CoA thioesterase FadM
MRLRGCHRRTHSVPHPFAFSLAKGWETSIPDQGRNRRLFYTGACWSRNPVLSHYISFVRIPALALRQRLWPLAPLGVLEEDHLRMRVWPNDIDVNLHLNNARYLNIMDYARIHLLARTQLLDHILRSRWKPMVGAVWITYRRSLPLFSAFTLSSRLVCWDERWFYIEQTFTGRDGLAAAGWVKGILRDANGNVAPQTVIDRVAPGQVSPPMPEAIATWNELTREKLAGG